MRHYMHLWYTTWREDLARYKINILEPSEVIVKAREPNVLVVTNCNATKGISEGSAIPKEFYVSKQNLRFYNWCEELDLRYGVISDEYGLFLCNEEKEYYDTIPGSLDKKRFRQLASLIYFKMESIDCTEFLYFGLPPVNCKPYFYMMLITGLKIFYTTKLPKE